MWNIRSAMIIMCFIDYHFNFYLFLELFLFRFGGMEKTIQNCILDIHLAFVWYFLCLSIYEMLPLYKYLKYKKKAAYSMLFLCKLVQVNQWGRSVLIKILLDYMIGTTASSFILFINSTRIPITLPGFSCTASAIVQITLNYFYNTFFIVDATIINIAAWCSRSKLWR